MPFDSQCGSRLSVTDADLPKPKCMQRSQRARRDNMIDSVTALPSNYDSTKVCFACLGFSPGNVAGKRKAWFILYRSAWRAAIPNCLIGFSSANESNASWQIVIVCPTAHRLSFARLHPSGSIPAIHADNSRPVICAWHQIPCATRCFDRSARGPASRLDF